MKKLVTALTVILVLVVFAAAGCTNTNMIGSPPGAGEEILSSCVSCHTDKALLQEVASPEYVEEVSEVTSGEG